VGGYLAARIAVLGTATVGSNGQPGLLYGEPLLVRVLTGLHLLLLYGKLLVWPVVLSADYSFRQIEIDRTAGVMQLGGLACVAGLAGGFVWALRRGVRPVVLAIGFFVITYAVIGNVVVPIGVLVAERLLYLPSIGFCIGLAWTGAALARRADERLAASWPTRSMGAALVMVLALYGARTWARNRDWADEETLYAATVAVSPWSAQAHYRYGTKLLGHGDRQSLVAARGEFLRTLELRPDHVSATANLAYAYLHLGDPGRAAETARRGLVQSPGHAILLKVVEQAEHQLAGTER
jgi:hypothetical protein